MNPYLNQVIELHTRIEALFSSGDISVATLLEHFHPDFSMVTADGDRITLLDVSHMFEQRKGSQPGLIIELTELEMLTESSDSALVCYREIHHLGKLEERPRHSTALFDMQSGLVLWRHLHETWSN